MHEAGRPSSARCSARRHSPVVPAFLVPLDRLRQRAVCRNRRGIAERHHGFRMVTAFYEIEFLPSIAMRELYDEALGMQRMAERAPPHAIASSLSDYGRSAAGGSV